MRRKALTTLLHTAAKLSAAQTSAASSGSGVGAGGGVHRWTNRSVTARSSSPRRLSTAVDNSTANRNSDISSTSISSSGVDEATSSERNPDGHVPMSLRIAGWSLAAASAGFVGVVAYVTHKYSQEEVVQKVAQMQKDDTPEPIRMVRDTSGWVRMSNSRAPGRDSLPSPFLLFLFGFSFERFFGVRGKFAARRQ